MISFKHVVHIGLLVIAVVNLASCNNNYRGANDGYDSAFVKFITPQKFSIRQVLVVETYDDLKCPVERDLNSHHENYRGRLLYHHSKEEQIENASVRVTANQPLTLALSLSQVLGMNDSSICYYPYHAFTPKLDAQYQVRLTVDSQVEYLLQETEKPECG